jgi:translation initiation factor IF-1
VPTEPITTTGKILAVLSDRAFRVQLPNGKEVIGHPSKALASEEPDLTPGKLVRLEMTPYDFEKARIAGIVV